jgi:hypothetical protein
LTGIYKIFMKDDVIWIVTDRLESSTDTRGERATGNIYEDEEVIGGVFREATHNAGDLGGMELDEIELMVEVNGEGQLGLLGNGGRAGGKGAITLKFKMTKSTSKK